MGPDNPCGTFMAESRCVDPGVKITVTGRRVSVFSEGGHFEADLPDAPRDDMEVRMCALVLLLPLAAKFAHSFPQLVHPSIVNNLAHVANLDRPEALRRSLRGAMTAAGVGAEAQGNIINAMRELQPDLFW